MPVSEHYEVLLPDGKIKLSKAKANGFGLELITSEEEARAEAEKIKKRRKLTKVRIVRVTKDHIDV